MPNLAGIDNFVIQPRKVVKGNTVTASGILLYKIGWISNPIMNEAVYLLVNNTELTSTITDSNGQFVFYWKPTLAGTYELMVKYKGSWAYESCQTIPVQVQVTEPSGGGGGEGGGGGQPPPDYTPYLIVGLLALGALVLWVVIRKK